MAITYTLLPSQVGTRGRLETQDFEDINVFVGAIAQTWSDGDVIEVYNTIDAPLVVALVGDTGVTLTADDGLVLQAGTYARVSRASATRWDVHVHKARTPVAHLSDVVVDAPANGHLLAYRPDAGVAVVTIAAGGSGFVDGTYPNVEFSGAATGAGMIATAYVVGGAVVGVVPTTAGQGYLLADNLIAIGNIDGVGGGGGAVFQVGTLTTPGKWHSEAPAAIQLFQSFTLTPLSGAFFAGSFDASWSLSQPSVSMLDFVTYDSYFGDFTFEQSGLYRIDVMMELTANSGWPVDNTEYGLQLTTNNGASTLTPSQYINHRAPPGAGAFATQTSMFGSFMVSSANGLAAPFGTFQLSSMARSHVSSGNPVSISIYVTVTRIADAVPGG